MESNSMDEEDFVYCKTLWHACVLLIKIPIAFS